MISVNVCAHFAYVASEYEQKAKWIQVEMVIAVCVFSMCGTISNGVCHWKAKRQKGKKQRATRPEKSSKNDESHMNINS